MSSPGDSAANLHGDVRALLEENSQMDSCGHFQSDFPADLHRDPKADSRRDLQEGFPMGFDGDFDDDARVEAEDEEPSSPYPRFRLHYFRV